MSSIKLRISLKQSRYGYLCSIKFEKNFFDYDRNAFDHNFVQLEAFGPSEGSLKSTLLMLLLLIMISLNGVHCLKLWHNEFF